MFIKKVIKVAVAIALLNVAAFLIAKLYDHQSQYSCDNKGLAVIAQRDDTYWKIAEQYCTGDIRSAVDDMMGNRGADLMPGAIINLP